MTRDGAVLRRIVTGTRAGRSTVVTDELLDGVSRPDRPGVRFWRMWGADSTTSFPADGSVPEHASFFPPHGGYRFVVTDLPPSGGEAAVPAADVPVEDLARAEALLGGALTGDPLAMHGTSDCVHLICILAGQVTMRMEDGSGAQLSAGDVVVQNGTRKEWINDGSVPVRMLAVFIGGDPASPDQP